MAAADIESAIDAGQMSAPPAAASCCIADMPSIKELIGGSRSFGSSSPACVTCDSLVIAAALPSFSHSASRALDGNAAVP